MATKEPQKGKGSGMSVRPDKSRYEALKSVGDSFTDEYVGRVRLAAKAMEIDARANALMSRVAGYNADAYRNDLERSLLSNRTANMSNARRMANAMMMRNSMRVRRAAEREYERLARANGMSVSELREMATNVFNYERGRVRRRK